MADFLQALDPSKLVLVGTALAFIVSPFEAPPYNLAIFLFGTYAQEANEAVQSLQTFTGLVGVSTIFDIVWMARHGQSGFIRFLTILILILKIPTLFVFASAVRQRGGNFSGLGIRGSDLSGATVWSMPGGFTSTARDGYQNLDEESFARPHKPTSSAPSLAPAPPPHSSAPTPVEAYQSA